MRSLRAPRRLGVMLIVIGVALGSALYAFAGHEPSSVPSYTGCLNPNGGTINNLVQGDTPGKPCNPNNSQIHLSGGDITAVVPGDGLVGGAGEGSAELSVDSSSIITGVQPGFGLTGGGSGGDLTLAVDPTKIQRRVSQDCESSGAISKIKESGDVKCSQTGVVATLNAGVIEAEGSHDTDLCEIGASGGDSEQSSVSAAVTLPAGTYLPVPASPPDDGFRWLINKTESQSDPDVVYRGRAWGFVKQAAGNIVVSQFIRDFSSAGNNNNLNQDWGVFTSGGGEFYLEIFAGADPCSFVQTGGKVALLKLG
jgi:hypothetical protein